jgi:mono/diheme cytochrome c family protein
MKLFKLVLVINSLALFAIACSDTNTNTANTGTQPSPAATPAATATPKPDEFAATREFYMDNCATCHQENGEGGTVKIDNKRLKVPPFSKGHALSHTDEEFAKQISSGGDGMPAYKEKMSPDEINTMVRYIRKQFQAGATNANATPTGRPMPAQSPAH